MNVRDLNRMVAGIVDTEGTSITAAEASRVSSMVFLVLASLPAEQAMSLVARGMQNALTTQRKKEAAQKKPRKKR